MPRPVSKCAGQFNRPGSVAVSLEHAHNSGRGLYFRPEEIEIMHHRVEVYLHERLVLFVLEYCHHLIHTRVAGGVDNDDFIVKVILDNTVRAGEVGCAALADAVSLGNLFQFGAIPAGGLFIDNNRYRNIAPA